MFLERIVFEKRLTMHLETDRVDEKSAYDYGNSDLKEFNSFYISWIIESEFLL